MRLADEAFSLAWRTGAGPRSDVDTPPAENESLVRKINNRDLRTRFSHFVAAGALLD
jgi:hypothetical protein